MAKTFRVALSSDFKKADGSPTFPDFDLAPLMSAPNTEVAFLENTNPMLSTKFTPATPLHADQLKVCIDPADPSLRRD